MKHYLFAASLIALSTAAHAQLNVFTIDIDELNSPFTWSGTSDLGPVVPDPTDAFTVSGTIDVRLSPGPGQLISTGEFLSADLQLNPEFAGRIPNPLFPATSLATLSVSGQRITVTSPPFAVAANGDFTANVTLSNTAGTLTVVDFLNNTTMTPLIGNPSQPTPFTGTFVLGEYGLDVSGPLMASFDFTDPTFGASGSFDIDGALAGSTSELHAPTFCAGDGGDQMGCTNCPCANNAPIGSPGGCLNGSMTSAELLPSGGVGVTTGDLRFEVTGANPTTFAVLLSGAARAPANMSNPCFGLDSGVQSSSFDGLRCAVQALRRHGGRPSDLNGDIGIANNGWGPPNAPMAGIATQGGFVAGQIRNFQAIYREMPGLQCGTGLNSTNGVVIQFVP